MNEASLLSLKNPSRSFHSSFISILFFCVMALLASASAQSPWPGQSGNSVGYTAWPGWTGSFNSTPCPSSPASGTSWANATVVQNCTYNAGSGANTVSCHFCEFIQVDFIAKINNQINGSNILFVGDRFQSNDAASNNVSAAGSNQFYFYDSMVPLVSLQASAPGSTWPSAGAGSNSRAMTGGTNATPAANGYGYSILINNNSGPIWIDHCDMWGFGNAIVMLTTTAQLTITNNWIHDPRDESTGDHTDGPGYLNGAVAPNNVTIIGNAVAMLGNTQTLALQGSTGGYQNIIVNNNFWSGNGATIALNVNGGVSGLTNSSFYGNTFGTDVEPGGPLNGPQLTMGTGSIWACNTISFRSGTTWTDLNDNWKPTSAMNGQYLIPPTGSGPNFVYNSATDLGSNTLCGMPAPSSINFGSQPVNSSSAGQTITLSSTNTGTLSISSVALATGTQFSISSNNCGSTLNSGSNCSITVKFSPTSLGPQTDTLRITDNTPGVSSPQLVPLLGVGTAGSPVDGSMKGTTLVR